MPTQLVNSSEQLNDLSGGWVPSLFPIIFLSSDSPSFVVTSAQNVTGTFGVGMKMQLTHQSSIKNFIITKVSLTGSTTYLNLYGGTDYTLNVTGAITNPLYSWEKSPFGFPVEPDKWSVIVTDTSLRTQATPTQNVWYNNGSIQINIPIGVWLVDYEAEVQSQKDTSSSSFISVYCTLSTANNSESDKKWTAIQYRAEGVAVLTQIQVFGSVTRSNQISLTSKATYFLNEMCDQNDCANLFFRGDLATTVIKARCAYL